MEKAVELEKELASYLYYNDYKAEMKYVENIGLDLDLEKQESQFKLYRFILDIVIPFNRIFKSEVFPKKLFNNIEQTDSGYIKIMSEMLSEIIVTDKDREEASELLHYVKHNSQCKLEV